MGYFWQNFGEKGGGAVLPDVLESQPTDSSHLLISWKMSPLKPVPQAVLWTGKVAETSANVPGICSNIVQCLQEVLVVYH